TTTVVARPGDVVGSEALTDVYDRYVGMNSRGDVAFVGVSGNAARLVLAADGHLTAVVGTSDAAAFAPPLTGCGGRVGGGGDRVVRWDGGQRTALETAVAPSLGVGFTPVTTSINNAGVTAFPVSRDAIYSFDAAGAHVVATAGQVIDWFGSIATFGALAAGR